jgi:hypothetical protein
VDWCPPYVRTVKNAPGATAVQIVYSSHRGSRDIEHIGSSRDDVQLEVLKAVACQRLAAGQDEPGLGRVTWLVGPDLSVRLAGSFAAARDPVPGGGSGRRELRSAMRSVAG